MTQLDFTCAVCGTPFHPKVAAVRNGYGKYCSRECSHIARRTSVARICEFCGKEFLAQPNTVKLGWAKFCSRRCAGLATPHPRIPVEERFWAKVSKDGPILREDLGACWIWAAGRFKKGYGMIQIGRKATFANRVSWELHYGPIPDGLWVLHKCDNPPCIRPDHLFLGTAGDNARDMAAKGRAGATVHPERLPRGDNHPWHLRPETIPHGEQHSQARLTDENVIEIRLRHGGGESQKSLCAAFGISASHMSGIIHRRFWKHLP